MGRRKGGRRKVYKRRRGLTEVKKIKRKTVNEGFVPLLERAFLITHEPIPIIFKSDVIECLKGLEKRKIMVKGSNYAVLWKDIKNIFGEVE